MYKYGLSDMLTIIRLSKSGEFPRRGGTGDLENEFEGVNGVRSVSGELVLGVLNISRPRMGVHISSGMLPAQDCGVLAAKEAPRADEVSGESMEMFSWREIM